MLISMAECIFIMMQIISQHSTLSSYAIRNASRVDRRRKRRICHRFRDREESGRDPRLETVPRWNWHTHRWHHIYPSVAAIVTISLDRAIVLRRMRVHRDKPSKKKTTYSCHSSCVARGTINVRNLYARTWHKWKRTLLDGPWKLHDCHRDWYRARALFDQRGGPREGPRRPRRAHLALVVETIVAHARDNTRIPFDLPAHINIAHDTHAILDTTARGDGKKKKHHAPSASRGARDAIYAPLRYVCRVLVPGLHLGACERMLVKKICYANRLTLRLI